MRLLPLEAFAHVFEPLQGKKIGYVRPFGNVGDALIEWAMRQLFDAFGIRWKHQDPQGPVEDVDELVFGGGGNMGTCYENNWRLRDRCLHIGRPMTILPQSFMSPEPQPFKRVYVRERASLRLAPNGVLAPDLALGLEYRCPLRPTKRQGVFLRKDYERTKQRAWFTNDPARQCRTPLEYLELAAHYEHVITNRLHFAICSLIVGRRTTLLPNSYHKNASMHETWLRDLGCQFAQSLEQVDRRRVA